MEDGKMNDEYLFYNEELKRYELDPEQAVRDDVEKNRWKLNWQLIVKDWRLYVMLIPMILVFVRELVHIIQENDGRSVLPGFGKGFSDFPNEIVIALVPPHNVSFQPAFFNETSGHQGLAQTRIPVKEEPLRQLRAKSLIEFFVVDHVTDLKKFGFDGIVTNHFVKCAHVYLQITC